MKKILILPLAALIAFGIAGCTAGKETIETTSQAPDAQVTSSDVETEEATATHDLWVTTRLLPRGVT